jgi:hypothetical protein
MSAIRIARNVLTILGETDSPVWAGDGRWTQCSNVSLRFDGIGTVHLGMKLQTIEPGNIASSFRMQQIDLFAHLSLKKFWNELMRDRGFLASRRK